MKTRISNTFQVGLLCIGFAVSCIDSQQSPVQSDKYDISPTDPPGTDTDAEAASTDAPSDMNDEQGLCSDDSAIESGECDCGTDEENCDGKPGLLMGKPFFVEDEPIVVNYTNLPGNQNDGIGLFAAHAALETPLQFSTTSGFVAGSLNFKPLPAGRYVTLLFIGGSTMPAHEQAFEVRLSDTPDACPEDPGKTDPGVCGCGEADVDDDGDGVPDCFDLCPQDKEKTDPGLCGCNVPEPDRDEDEDEATHCDDAEKELKSERWWEGKKPELKLL